jgi:hypothetical protein
LLGRPYLEKSIVSDVFVKLTDKVRSMLI